MKEARIKSKKWWTSGLSNVIYGLPIQIGKLWKQVHRGLYPGLMFMLSSCHFQELPSLQPVSFQELPGWEADDFTDAAEAWHASCRFLARRTGNDHAKIPSEDWQYVCKAARNYPLDSPEGFKNYLQEYFNAFKVRDSKTDRSEGLFTGYYEPVLQGSRTPDQQFRYPVYRRPPELVLIEELGIFRPELRGHRIAGTVENGTLKPYFSRQQIDQGVLNGRDLELAWVDDPISLFWMHIQGSGKIVLKDGSTMHLGYHGTNGHSYTAIGRVIREKASLPMESITMQNLQRWLEKHPHAQAEIFWQNRSYVFFKNLDANLKSPLGRIGEPLVPLRSLAIDPVHIPSGAPLWVDIEGPLGTPRIQKLFFAHDVGGAIKGAIRGDVFWGSGEIAARMAGAMRSGGSYYLILPKPRPVLKK